MEESFDRDLSTTANLNGIGGVGCGAGQRDELITTDAHLITMMAETISEINNRRAATVNESAGITFMEALQMTEPPPQSLSIVTVGTIGAIITGNPSPVRRDSGQASEEELRHGSLNKPEQVKKTKKKKMCQSTFYVPVNDSDIDEEGEEALVAGDD